MEQSVDPAIAAIADYACTLRYEDLPADVVRQVKRCFVDTVGCALGAYGAEPARIARRLAERGSSTRGARVIGSSVRTLPEFAAFANGVMARYLDANDAYPGGGGHPSDMISGLFALADDRQTGGTRLITAIVVAYEVYHNLWKSLSLRRKGMDNVFYSTVGAAAGSAALLGLDRTRAMEALSLAITPNIPLDATRYGHIGMWKGCAGGNASRNAVFAALLAEAGLTGPENAFSGEHGLRNLAGDFELGAFAEAGAAFRIAEVTFKCYFAEAHTIPPISAAVELAPKVEWENIERVRIGTYAFAYEVVGSGAAKWRPGTRESADHSMPYVVAATLVDGKFDTAAFDDVHLRDPRIVEVMDRIEIHEDPELTKRVPAHMPCRMTIETRAGETLVAEIDYPRGHWRNPMSDAELEAKFIGLATPLISAASAQRAISALWQLDRIDNFDDIFDAVHVEV